MHYREKGEESNSTHTTNYVQDMEMQWNTPFQGCISFSSSLIVDTYCSVVVSNLGYFLPVLMWIPSRFDRIG